MNSQARTILSECDGLSVEQDCLSTATGPCTMEGLTRVLRPSGREPYVLWITALYNGSPGSTYRAVTIYQSSQRKQLDLALLKATYKFTRAELALAGQILFGRRPQEAADELGVTIHSVRTYLKRLYNKVGVRTQARLVHKLLEVVHSLPQDPR